MSTHRMQPLACPVCQSKLSAASNLGEEDTRPETGDVTMCAYCTSVFEFQEDGTLEQIDIKTLHPEVQDIMAAAIIHFQQHRPTFH